MSEHLRTNVDLTLELCANKGVFRSFSRVLTRNKVVYYRMQWHQDRFYDLVFDAARRSLRFPVVLPKVPRAMYDDFKKFVATRQTVEMLEHRRIDPKKVRISCSLKNDNISLLFIARDGDYQYATQKLIHLMHEIFLIFLKDGMYYEYMIETFDVDRDHI